MKSQNLRLIDAPPLLVQRSALSVATVSDAVDSSVTPTDEATNGQIPIGRTGLPALLNEIDGTANQVIVTNGSGTITLSTPQNIHTGASPQFAGLTLSGLTAKGMLYADASKAVVSTAVASNGQLLIGSTGAVPVLGTLTAGNSISITNGAGSITIDTIQDIRTSAAPTFTGLTISSSGTGVTIGAAGGGANSLIVSGGVNVSALKIFGSNSAGQSYGLQIEGGSNNSDYAVAVRNLSATSIFYLAGDGALTLHGTVSGVTTLTATTVVAALTGNASTATALQTPRTINGVSFDGTANITVTAAAGTLTGTTLNSTVVTSSLTTVGILASPHMTSPVVDSGGLTVTAGGVTVTGNSTITGTLGSITTLTATTGNLTSLAVSTGGVTIGALASGNSLAVTGSANNFAVTITGNSTSGQSYGQLITAGTNASDAGLRVRNTSNATLFEVLGSGAITVAGAISGVTTLTATTLAGTLSTAAQPNVTSLGTLTSLTINGVLTLTGTTGIAASSDAGMEFRQTVAISDATTVGALMFYRSRGTIASPSIIVDGDDLGRVGCWVHGGSGGTGGYFEGAYILFEVAGLVTSGQAPPTRMRFFTCAANGTPTEIQRYTPTGQVQINGANGLIVSSGAMDTGSGVVYKVNGTQVVTARQTGYAAWTTTAANRGTSYDAATITLAQLAARVRALQDDLTTHGLIGA